MKNPLETLKKENKELKQKVHNIDKLELDNKILNTTLESNENEVVRLINEFNSEIDELKKNAYKCDDCDECFDTKSKFKSHIVTKHVGNYSKCTQCDECVPNDSSMNQVFP